MLCDCAGVAPRADAGVGAGRIRKPRVSAGRLHSEVHPSALGMGRIWRSTSRRVSGVCAGLLGVRGYSEVI